MDSSQPLKLIFRTKLFLMMLIAKSERCFFLSLIAKSFDTNPYFQDNMSKDFAPE
jgi:hypothetical protein